MITLCCRFKSLCSCFVSLCSQRTSLCGRCASLCSRFNRHLSGCLACINGSFMFFCSCFIDLNKLTNVRDPGFTYSCCCLFFVLGCLINCLVLNLWFCEVCIQHTTFVRLLSAVDHLKDFLICTKVPLLTKSTEIRHPRHYLLYYVCNNNVTNANKLQLLNRQSSVISSALMLTSHFNTEIFQMPEQLKWEFMYNENQGHI